MISYLVSSLITTILATQQYPFYNIKKKKIIVTTRKALNGLLRALAQA